MVRMQRIQPVLGSPDILSLLGMSSIQKIHILFTLVRMIWIIPYLLLFSLSQVRSAVTQTPGVLLVTILTDTKYGEHKL